MKGESIYNREQIEKLGIKLKEITDQANASYTHKENNYQDLSVIIEFIKQNTEKFTLESLNKLIFIVGPSGAGKSTLLNYINSEDGNFEVINDVGAIQVKENSIAIIGDGKGSTTLFPNIHVSSFGNFIDFAGEGDTGGVVAEVINSTLKSKIASNTENVKILFVTKEASLGSNGGYGAIFKTALDKNASFLGDINYFKNSIGLIISGATPKKFALENSLEAVKNILLKHANLDNYKEALENIINQKNVATFSRPLESLEVGETYQAPSWNPNQKDNIVSMLNKLPFTQIPHKDYFNTSTTPEVREIMKKALLVLEIKAGDTIKQTIHASLPITIHSVEMHAFASYINMLTKSHNISLEDYIKVLRWNDYFKTPAKENIVKINDEINYLLPFTQDPSERKKEEVLKKDWGKIAEVSDTFSKAYEGVQKIISSSGNTFSKFKTESILTTKSASSSAETIASNFKQLYELYKKLDETQTLGKQQDSEYYKDVTKKEFSHKEEISYTEKEQYVEIENYLSQEDYQDLESYTETITSTRPVSKTKEESYTELQPLVKSRIEEYTEQQEKFEKVTKYRTETYTKEEDAPVRTIFTHLFTLGLGTFGKGLVTGNPIYTDTITDTRKVPYDDWERRVVDVKKTKEVPYIDYEEVTKTREISYLENEEYKEEVTKYRPITKTQTVEKSRPVTKEREVTKSREEDVYKDLVLRELDKDKYDPAISELDNKIAEVRKAINIDISNYPKGTSKPHEKEPIQLKDQYEEKYKDLQTAWQNAEYDAYFHEKNNASLAEYTEIMGYIPDHDGCIG